MRHFFTAIFFFCSFFIFAQTNKTLLETSELPELYVEISLNSKAEVQTLGAEFIIDKVSYDADNQQYSVVVWLPQHDFARFAAMEIPFEIQSTSAAKVTADMASSYSEMLAWNKYPKYATYLAMMDSFQRKYPNLCKIDTILAATPGNHKILAAHISPNVGTPNGKPQFYYGSTIHGDEVTGFALMLRLIHYLISNYENDATVTALMNNLNIWICPLENPDGTYRTSNNNLGSSPTSTRANKNNIDLNRSFPNMVQNVGQLQPEVSALINFASAHNFVLSAEFHGGAELANYPWDSWTSRQKKHSDDAWWQMVARRYADSAQHYSNNYFREEQNGITNGGDWYVIYNSRQDYMNYYQFCREITLEISATKAPRSSNLPTYWNYNRAALLTYMQEATFGVHGTVLDAHTSQPIEAQVFIAGHDSLNAHCFSHLPFGDYHRPLKAGTYTLTFSADGYCEKTETVTISDRQTLQLNVQLSPFPCNEEPELPEPPDTLVAPDPIIPNFPRDNGNLAILDDNNSYFSEHYFDKMPTLNGEAEQDNGDENEGENDGVSISEFCGDAPLFTIFPNPVQQILNVQFSNFAETRLRAYRITDLCGRLLQAGTLGAATAQIEVGALPAGIYLFHVDGVGSARFVK